MRSTIKHRQSLVDIALQECGTMEALMEVSAAFDLPVTGELTPGGTLEAEGLTVDQNEYAAMRRYNARPATAITQQDKNEAPYSGINYMAIEIDFIVG